MKHYKLFTFLSFLTLATVGNAQMARFYTSEYGLPNSQINDLTQDSKGFIWVSTENGLARFDGRSFTTFRFDPSRTDALASNLVMTIKEDSHGVFWTGTSAGLQVFDPDYNTFSKFDLGDLSVPNSSQYITGIIEVPTVTGSEIWVSTSQHGVYVIDAKTHKLVSEKRNTLNSNLPTTYINGIFLDSSGRVWMSNEDVGGIFVVDSRTGVLLSDTFWTPETSSLSKIVVAQDYAEDPSTGNIIIGTFNCGILIFDAETGKIRASKDRYASTCRVQCLLRDSSIQRAGDHSFLVGVENRGILVYDLETDTSHSLSLANIPYDISTWKVHALFEDVQGNIWVGAFQTGLMVIPKSMYGFEYVSTSTDSRFGGNSSCVTSVLRDSYNGDLWVGTDGGGIVQITPDGRKYSYTAANSALSNNSVMSLAMDNSGTLWIATYLDGLFVRPRGGEIHRATNANHLGSVRTESLAYDSRNNVLYVGTHGNGFSIIDPTDGRVIRTISEIMNKWVSALFIDSDGMLWVGTYNGLLCYNSNVGQLISYNVGPAGVRARIYCFCEGTGGVMWIGTGEGLIYFDRARNDLRLYTETEGLSNNVVNAIRESSDGNLWISTSYGLSRLIPSSGRFTRYFSYDGLQENEFHHGASFVDEDGKIYFGGINGITAFYPKMVDQKAHDLPPLYFTSLTAMNKEIEFDASAEHNILDKHITEATSITLPYRTNTFSLGFAVLEYTNPRKVQYMYKLNHSDPEWHHTSQANALATYTNLPSGRYELQVRAYLEDEEDEFSTRSIKIRILPPWYETFWAYLLYILLLLSGFYLIHRLVVARRKRIHEKEQSEIRDLKLQMFTNISHEIRSPLTLVMSPLKKMRESETDPKQKSLYNLMYRNSLRILRIVNQLMDIRKIDDGQMQMHFLETDIIYFIKEIMHSFDNLAMTRNIDYSITSSTDVLNLWVDQGNFDKIIFNIISNAFKYTKDGGKIEVIVSDTVRNNGELPSNIAEFVKIRITNTDSHIDEKNLERVFERFFQSDVLDAKGGSGVGLSLAKMLIDLHHGKISASNTETGVCFTVLLPAGKDHLSAEELSLTSHHKDLYTKQMNIEEFTDTTEDISYHSETESLDKAVKSRKTIIIVDDDDELRDYLRMELRGQYNVQAYANGRSAWGEISTTVPDVVITDLLMEPMDGEELCTKIKHNPGTNHIPVIILTSQNDEASVQRCLDCGADRFFTKPISMDLLRSAIANAISNSDTIRSKYSNEVDYKYDELKVNSSKSLVERVIEAIKTNIDKPEFGVEDLSREIGMSRVHMNRKLKEAIGQSPSGLIRSIRLKQAAYLLINDKVNISEVAYRVGFSTHSYFSSSFRDYFGMTPKEFVDKYQDCHDEETLKKLFQ